MAGIFGFGNDKHMGRTRQEGSLRGNEGKRSRLDFDLNYPLPGQDMTSPYDMPSHALSQNGQVEVDSQIQHQPQTEVETIDDEVCIISPRLFAQASKKPRRDTNAVGDTVTVQANDVNTSNVASSMRQPAQAPMFRCPICMGNLREATSTRCGHIFCEACIEGALLFQKKCPTCRKSFRGKGTFRVYLPTAN